MRLVPVADAARRRVLTSVLGALAATAPPFAPAFAATKSKLGYDLTPLTRDEVKEAAAKLTPFERSVSLEAVTEFSFTGKTTNGYSHDNKAEGIYVGAISKMPVFSSKEKYDSGTGWPSFWAPVSDDHVTLRLDPGDLARKSRRPRVEVLDAKSGAHLGHVFSDGPAPTGMRYCMNAAALTFVPNGKLNGKL